MLLCLCICFLWGHDPFFFFFILFPVVVVEVYVEWHIHSTNCYESRLYVETFAPSIQK